MVTACIASALLRVRNPTTAEDLVQETLLAAWRAKDSFAGQSAERTWLIAILKNKLIDHFRRTSRETPLPDMADTDDAIDALFNEHTDHWLHPPAAWSRPDNAWNRLNSGRSFRTVSRACRHARRGPLH